MFASRDSYKNLSLIRDVEPLMKSLILSLRGAMKAFEKNEASRISCENVISGLESAFSGFDRLPLTDKTSRIEKAFTLLGEMNGLISHSLLAYAGKESIRMDFVRDCNAKLMLPVGSVRGIGQKNARLLNKKSISTVEDLLFFVPRRYEDRRFIKDIYSAKPGFRETVMGEVREAETKYYGRKRIFEVTVGDTKGSLKAKWFKGRHEYLKKIFKKGRRVIMTGDLRSFYSSKEMIHPDFELLDDDEDMGDLLHFKRIIPIYSETEGLHQKYLRRILSHALQEYAKYVISPIPEDICRSRRLDSMHVAIQSVHFPGMDENVIELNEMRSESQRRIIYDELFFLQLGIALKKKANLVDVGIVFKTGGQLLGKFYNILPFRLTAAQDRVIREIEANMRKRSSMNRLLQGDVGCGKTVVSMVAMITACENGRQAAIMAPTEILAEQHYHRIKGWAAELGLEVVLLTGNTKYRERKCIIKKINDGAVCIVVGTHSLIQEDVAFGNLGLVIIDEQHRFGVIQRATLRKKGVNPDVLVMTATPIPRTLAMTVYGDLDISIIDEYPPGRKEILTKIFYEEQRSSVYNTIQRELDKGNQVFIVYPLVEESENLDLKNATEMAEHLQREIFPSYRVGLIHGRMRGKEKDRIMAGFLGKEVDILVSTTVIEVGIDIPDASLMIIEHAERFGLSQLHQLRGRVGRGNIPSSCILISSSDSSEEAKKRLRVMEKTNDGFKIAEEDLAIRGPGEFLGMRQSGIPDFRIAHILRDVKLLYEARADAFSVIEKDPHLEKSEHAILREVLLHKWGQRLDLARTG